MDGHREQGWPTSLDRLAKEIAESFARHQSRGLVDDTMGMADVVIHGRVNLLAVADEVLAASIAQLKPARKSWGGWFISRTESRRRGRRHERECQNLAEKLMSGSSALDAAITRLRIRKVGP